MKHFFITCAVLGLVLAPVSAHAQDEVKCSFKDFGSGFDCVKQLGTKSKVTEDDPVKIVLQVLKTVLTLVAIAGVIGLIIAGGMYMFSAGEEQKAAKAKKAILYVIIGLLIIGASILIVNLVINAFQTPAGKPQPS